MENNNRFIENQEIRKRIETILKEEEFKMLSESWRQIDNWYFNKFKPSNSEKTKEMLFDDLKDILIDKDKYTIFVYRKMDILNEISNDVYAINYKTINLNYDLYYKYQMLASMTYLGVGNEDIGNIHLLNHSTKSFLMDIEDPPRLRIPKTLSLLHEHPEYIQQAWYYFITLERMKLLQYYFIKLKGILLKINYNFMNPDPSIY